MYNWKNFPLSPSLEDKLNQLEDDFINSLADIVTQQIMDCLELSNQEQVERLICQIKENPSIIGLMGRNADAKVKGGEG